MYLLTIGLTKASILLFYLRLFGTPGTRPGLRKLLYTTQILVTVWLIASIIPGIHRCRPIDDMWNPLIFSGPDVRKHCIDENAYYVSTSVFNVALDFWILVLPLSIVWTLQLSRRRKIGLIAIFLLGVLYVIWRYLVFAKPVQHMHILIARVVPAAQVLPGHALSPMLVFPIYLVSCEYSCWSFNGLDIHLKPLQADHDRQCYTINDLV